MKILADKNLPLVKELFSPFGDLNLISGRDIKNEDLVGVDALVVRSTTEVSKSLLTNTSLKFVGTATSGIDHISVDELAERGIYFADAKGCNANAVSDYCLSAVATIFGDKISAGHILKFGIIGNGSIGSKLSGKIKALNWETLICDPPQKDKGTEFLESVSYEPLQHLSSCDVVSVHVPLTTSGKYPTKNLIDNTFLNSLSDNTVLINTSRGGVVDEESLLDSLNKNSQLISVIDVWSGEPFCNQQLVEKSFIATPHIAGYSGKAKKTASIKIFKEFCRCFNFDYSEVASPHLKLENIPVRRDSSKFSDAINQVLPIMDFSAEFKSLLRNAEEKNRASIFDTLRLKLSGRYEFCEYVAPKMLSQEQTEFLFAAGFNS